jgi:hypothetical protein
VFRWLCGTPSASPPAGPWPLGPSRPLRRCRGPGPLGRAGCEVILPWFLGLSSPHANADRIHGACIENSRPLSAMGMVRALRAVDSRSLVENTGHDAGQEGAQQITFWVRSKATWWDGLPVGTDPPEKPRRGRPGACDRGHNDPYEADVACDGARCEGLPSRRAWASASVDVLRTQPSSTDEGPWVPHAMFRSASDA